MSRATRNRRRGFQGVRSAVPIAAPRKHPQLAEVVRSLVMSGHPDRFLELYYWSREPDLVEIMRALAGVPDAARSNLRAFLELAKGDLASVSATVSDRGRLVLTRAHVAAAIEPFARDDDKKPTVN